MSDRIGRALRRSGLAQAIVPPEALRRQEQTQRLLTADGELEAWVTRRLRTPLRFDWDVGGALAPGGVPAVRECPRPGTVTRLAAHVGSAPTDGNLIVRLLVESPGSGATPVAVVTVVAGERTGVFEVAEPIPAGSWLGIEVAQAGGAADLSVSATVQTGG